MAGKIIVVEGTDCSGKETQTKLLEKRLTDSGEKCIRFSFPMYDTPTGQIVGGSYLGKPEISPSLFKEGAVNVDPHVVKVTYDAFGPKRMTLITDAMLGKDMPDGPYTFSSLNCIKKGKTVQVKETGRISGSCIGMNDALKNIIRK